MGLLGLTCISAAGNGHVLFVYCISPQSMLSTEQRALSRLRESARDSPILARPSQFAERVVLVLSKSIVWLQVVRWWWWWCESIQYG